LQARDATSGDGRRHEIGLKALDILLRRIEGIDEFPSHTFPGVDLPPLEFELLGSDRLVFEVFPQGY
jgi:hypothetical protein